MDRPVREALDRLSSQIVGLGALQAVVAEGLSLMESAIYDPIADVYAVQLPGALVRRARTLLSA